MNHHSPCTDAKNSPVLYKRIGHTDYELTIHFNADGKETMNDKIVRLLRNEAEMK